jgi:hypothetical protein
LKIAASAGFATERETRSGRKPRRVNTIGNDADVLPAEIVAQELRRAPRDSGEKHFRVRIDAAFQGREKGVVQTAMDTEKNPGSSDYGVILAGKPLEAMKERVDNEDIGVETIHAR